MLLVLRSSDKLYMYFLVLQVTRYPAQKLADVNRWKAVRQTLSGIISYYTVAFRSNFIR